MNRVHHQGREWPQAPATRSTQSGMERIPRLQRKEPRHEDDLHGKRPIIQGQLPGWTDSAGWHLPVVRSHPRNPRSTSQRNVVPCSFLLIQQLRGSIKKCRFDANGHSFYRYPPLCLVKMDTFFYTLFQVLLYQLHFNTMSWSLTQTRVILFDVTLKLSWVSQYFLQIFEALLRMSSDLMDYTEHVHMSVFKQDHPSQKSNA